MEYKIENKLSLFLALIANNPKSKNIKLNRADSL